MNDNLLAIVNRIIAEQGEDILADAKRLFPFFADYAKNEYKEDRIAFGRCIESGAYHELKKTTTADERQRVKAMLAGQINAKTGVDRPRCADALDLLEAVIFKPEQQNTPPQQPVQPSSPSGDTEDPEKVKLTVVQKIIVLLVVVAFSILTFDSNLFGIENVFINKSINILSSLVWGWMVFGGFKEYNKSKITGKKFSVLFDGDYTVGQNIIMIFLMLIAGALIVLPHFIMEDASLKIRLVINGITFIVMSVIYGKISDYFTHK
ncbi:MAG: hypothetical protein LBC76_09620 [Treponema sp.]|jgi:hypothetical protein|nr:hypothetical protein [Treponema sp.]